MSEVCLYVVVRKEKKDLLRGMMGTNEEVNGMNFEDMRAASDWEAEEWV